MSKPSRLFVLAAALCALATAASAQNMSYRVRQSPEENNILSARYDHLLQTNLAFRHYRMRKECRPINDPALNADCLSSFDTYEPWRGGE
ncbi:MAG TPA: hypothetical protein VFW46_12500 [Stellaceae bacterium]|jgi:hypothetical protein|nr:hypothetical protein [Stellaceae bacterium]